jgi:hypothetical protein
VPRHPETNRELNPPSARQGHTWSSEKCCPTHRGAYTRRHGQRFVALLLCAPCVCDSSESSVAGWSHGAPSPDRERRSPPPLASSSPAVDQKLGIIVGSLGRFRRILWRDGSCREEGLLYGRVLLYRSEPPSLPLRLPMRPPPPRRCLRLPSPPMRF